MPFKNIVLNLLQPLLTCSNILQHYIFFLSLSLVFFFFFHFGMVSYANSLLQKANVSMATDLFLFQKSKNLLVFLSISEIEYYHWSSVTQRTVACQAPLALGFTREQYWTGLPCPLLWDLLNPGI